MIMKLYCQAITTLKITTAVQAIKDHTSTFIKRYGIFELTVAKGKNQMMLMITTIFHIVSR